MRRLAFHLAVVVHHLSCAYFFRAIDFSSVTNDTVKNMSRMRRSYLTGWNFAIQATYFVVSLAEDVVRLNKTSQLSSLFQHRILRAVKNGIFATIVFPVSCYVCLTFWTFFTYNRELVYPAAIDEVLPLWYNHSLHTSILVAAILEMWLVFHPYPRRKWGMVCILAFNACYLTCMLLTRYWLGLWVYPMFDLMNWPQRIGMFLFSQLAMWGLYEMGNCLNTFFWGDTANPRVNGKTRKKLR